ncbi:hypothetical protein D3C73_1343780 [compost metagenome]
MCSLADGRQIRHFHRYRARCLRPDQACIRLDQFGDAAAYQRIVITCSDAEILLQPVCQLAVRVIDVIRNQYIVAAFEEGEIDQCDCRQAAGCQHAMLAVFNRGQSRFQRESGRCAVQAVGIGILVLPVA